MQGLPAAEAPLAVCFKDSVSLVFGRCRRLVLLLAPMTGSSRPETRGLDNPS